MTVHPIDTEALRREALGQLGRVAADPRWPGRVLALLDLLAAAVHRATRAEAQSAIRGRAVVVYRERAREAEAERDEWREASAKLAASSNQANADLYEAETRIERLGNRAETETARADEWRRRHRVMAGKRDAAHRAYVEEREARREAEARIKAVEDVLDRPIRLVAWDDPLVSATHVRRALDGDA